MNTGDVILFSAWQQTRGMSPEMRRIALDAAERERLEALERQELVKKIMADGFAR